MMKVTTVLLVGLLSGASLVAAENGAPRNGTSQMVQELEAGEKQTIVAYGTSLTKIGAWSDQLRAVLEQNYPGQVTLINSAQGGSNSVWGRKSFDEKVIQKHPDTVFIEFAINDSVASRKVSISDARGNLEDMIDRLLKSNPNCAIYPMSLRSNDWPTRTAMRATPSPPSIV